MRKRVGEVLMGVSLLGTAVYVFRTLGKPKPPAQVTGVKVRKR